jgi:uncharacterized protein YjbJ (UPF0337 family)
MFGWDGTSEAAGNATGEREMQAKGEAQETKGDAQQAKGKVKDVVKNVVDKR